MATRQTRAQRQAATRTELLDAARRVFLERGYHGASLDLVAGEAGYTKGAVYSAFGSKPDLFLALYEREVDGRWRRIEQDVTAALAAGETLDPARRPAHDFAARVRAERAWTLTLLEFRLHAARDPQVNAAYAARHADVVARMETVLVRLGIPAGRAHELALSLMALSNGWALEHLALPDEATEERYVAAFSALVDTLRGTREPSP